MIRAVIIDDEPAGIKAMHLLIEKYVQQVKVVATTTRAREGVSLIENYRPEIVFLDISMPGLDGFALLRELTYRDFILVFTTAHRQYAIQAIRHHPFDYLLKPIDPEELKSCITRIAAETKNTPAKTAFGNTIGLSVKDGLIIIRTTDIIRLEASGSYTYFYLDNKVRHVASRPLREYEALLNPVVFYRCHNSHLVNLQKVVKVLTTDGFLALMTDGSTAVIARKNKEHLIGMLMQTGK